MFSECTAKLDGSKDTAPGSHYPEIPVGCRVSNGLGLTVMLSMLFVLFALRNRMLIMRKPKQATNSTQPKRSFMDMLMSPLYNLRRSGSGKEEEGGEEDSHSVNSVHDSLASVASPTRPSVDTMRSARASSFA